MWKKIALHLVAFKTHFSISFLRVLMDLFIGHLWVVRVGERERGREVVPVNSCRKQCNNYMKFRLCLGREVFVLPVNHHWAVNGHCVVWTISQRVISPWGTSSDTRLMRLWWKHMSHTPLWYYTIITGTMSLWHRSRDKQKQSTIMKTAEHNVNLV